jgi:hypothetical protein
MSSPGISSGNAEPPGSAAVMLPSDTVPRHHGPTVLVGNRSRSIRDARFPFGRAQILAWNVELQGNSDLSTFLCRSAFGAYFLYCRPGSRPRVAPAIVPLSHARAVAWFEAHPVRFADRDVLR